MQISEKRLEKIDLVQRFGRCFIPFHKAECPMDALKSVSSWVTADFGKNIKFLVFDNLDDLSLGLIDLLDQIVFEVEEEHISLESPIDEYIIDDLYSRAGAYLDVITDVNIYKKNLRERPLNPDDPLIIRCHGLNEFIPLLMTEFFEQPNLRLIVLKSLLFMEDDDLLHFFYEIARNNYDYELKIPAMIGLKKFRYRFDNWYLLTEDGKDDFNELVEFARTFDPGSYAETGFHRNPFILLFMLSFIETGMAAGMVNGNVEWLIDFMVHATECGMQSGAFQSAVFQSIASILPRIGICDLKTVISDREYMARFLNLVDSLPVEIFDKVMIVINRLGSDFLMNVRRIISDGEINLQEKNSNLLGYLFSLGFNSLPA